MACSKTPWGKKVIEDIDVALLKKRSGPAYRAAYERWLDDSGIQAYRQAYDKYFISVKQ